MDGKENLGIFYSWLLALHSLGTKPCLGVDGNFLSECGETSRLDQPKKGNWISYSPLQPFPTVNQGISEIKAKQVFEAERWRGEGQPKVFCLWKRHSGGKVWWWVRGAREEPQCNHETGFCVEGMKANLSLASYPVLGSTNPFTNMARLSSLEVSPLLTVCKN